MTTTNQNSLGKNVYYNYDDIDHKYFFATYINTATLNVFKIFNAITEILNIREKEKHKSSKKLFNELKVDTQLDEHPLIKKLVEENAKNITLQYAIMNLLDSYLPSTLIGSKDPKIAGENLQRNIRYLIAYRNFYSHYLPSITFESVERSFDETTNKKFHKQLQHLKIEAIAISEDRLGLERNKTEWIAKATQEKASIEDLQPYSNFKRQLNTTTKKIDLNNFLFFLSLLLTKKEMTELLNCIGGKKSTLYPAHRWVRNIFLVLNAKHFKTKIVSSDTKQALSLNILNDLSRIPYRLKDVLNKQGKNNLYITSEEALGAYSGTDDDEDSNYENKIELVRHGNLLPYQALQFIELNNLVPNMKFKLHLGKVFTVAPYQKKIGSNIIKRELTKNLYVHGRLNDYDESYYADYIQKQNNAITAFIEPLKYYSPKYHFSNNRIGIRFRKENKEIPITGYEDVNGKKVFSHKNELSEFIISHNFIPFLIYWMIKTDNPNRIEGVFKSFAKNFRSLLQDIADKDMLIQEDVTTNFEKFLKDNYELQSNWIPTKIKNFVFKKQKDKKAYALSKIKYCIKKAEKFEAENSTEDNKLENASLKAGEMATEVVKDIVRMMVVTKNNKGIDEKLSSAEYQLLQATLALKTTTEFHQLYKELNLFTKHPFLKEVNIQVKKGTARTISSYFSQYFKASRYYLNKLHKQIQNGTLSVEDEALHFIDVDTFKTSYQDIKNYANHLLTKEASGDYLHPIYIPNDLLKEEIATLNNIPTDKEINSTYAVMQGLTNDKQWFYKEVYRKKLPDNKLKYKTDKQFRYDWVMDSILWEMLKKNVQSNKELNTALENLSLANYIEPQHDDDESGSNSILSTRVEQILTFKLPQEVTSERVEPIKVYVTINRKLKEVGAYRHLSKDLRIPSILSYYTECCNNQDKTIPIEQLEKELEAYHKRKFITLQKIFEFEKHICANNTTIYKKHLAQHKGSFINFREFMEEVFSKNSNIQKIITIRNSLLHNKLPLAINISESSSSSSELKVPLIFDKCDKLITLLL